MDAQEGVGVQSMGVDHGSTAREKTVYERVVDLARIGDTWLAQGSHVGGLACGTSDMDMRLGAGGVSVTLG